MFVTEHGVGSFTCAVQFIIWILEHQVNREFWMLFADVEVLSTIRCFPETFGFNVNPVSYLPVWVVGVSHLIGDLILFVT